MVELCVTVITGLFTIGGVALGGMLSNRHDQQSARRTEIVHCYADFFQAYAAFTADSSESRKGQLVYAMEVARLLLPNNSATLVAEFEHSFLKAPHNPGSRTHLLNQIRQQAVEDVSSFESKHNRRTDRKK